MYQHFNFLTSLRELSGRQRLLVNMTSAQTKAIVEIAKRIVHGSIQIVRRDIQTFRNNRISLRSLASPTVCWTRKKYVLKKNASLVAVLVREVYVMQTIGDEIIRGMENREQ